MTRVARSTMGTPVTLEMYGTVRDARGFTSMTYSFALIDEILDVD
jgi:hypothetical protein